MKIVVATGLFPPDVGGPAQYAHGVQEALEKAGHEAPVAWFGALRGYPSGIRHAIFFFRLLQVSRGASAIIAFDTSLVGATAAFVGMLRGIPVIVRVGGDFVWESYVERTKDLVPLPDFYRVPRPLSIKEACAQKLVAWTLRHAHPAFNTQWLLDIWREPYHLEADRMRVVGNVIPPREPHTGSSGRTILLYARQIVLKNAAAFRGALEQSDVDLTLETGNVPYAAYRERVRACYAVAVPSISEVAPNTVIEAICAGKPFILTKYSGYAELYRDLGIIIDPLSETDMERGLREIADPAIYEKLSANIVAFTDVRTYEDVTREFLALLY